MKNQIIKNLISFDINDDNRLKRCFLIKGEFATKRKNFTEFNLGIVRWVDSGKESKVKEDAIKYIQDKINEALNNGFWEINGKIKKIDLNRKPIYRIIPFTEEEIKVCKRVK